MPMTIEQAVLLLKATLIIELWNMLLVCRVNHRMDLNAAFYAENGENAPVYPCWPFLSTSDLYIMHIPFVSDLDGLVEKHSGAEHCLWRDVLGSKNSFGKSPTYSDSIPLAFERINEESECYRVTQLKA